MLAPSPRFTASQIRVITIQPAKWTTPPVYTNGVITTPGVIATPLDGVHILLGADIIAWLKIALTTAQRTALDSYTKRLYTDEDTNPARPVDDRLATWQANGTMPGWAGQTEHVFVRFPAAVWNVPTATNPPAAVKTFIQKYWQA